MLRILLLLASNSIAFLGKDRFKKALLSLLARTAGLLVVACLGMVAAAFATAALYLWLHHHLPAPVAALVMAGFFLVLAATGFLVVRSIGREKRPSSGAAKEVDRLRDAAEGTLLAVTRQPGKSVLTAVAVGIAVGMALRRR